MTDMQRTMVSGKGRDVALVLLVFLYLRFLQLDVRGHLGAFSDGSIRSHHPNDFFGFVHFHVGTWGGLVG